MKIKELANLAHSCIKVKDGYDGKVLCYRYTDGKHKHLAEREVLSVWTEIDVKNNMGYSGSAKSIICVYVEHKDGEKNDLRS